MQDTGDGFVFGASVFGGDGTVPARSSWDDEARAHYPTRADHSAMLVAADVRDNVSKLERYHGRINSCRVVIEAPHRRHRKGKIYHVGVEVSVPVNG